MKRRCFSWFLILWGKGFLECFVGREINSNGLQIRDIGCINGFTKKILQLGKYF